MKPMAGMKPMQALEPLTPMKPMQPMEPMKAQKPWWPAELGSPDSTGSQNDTRYAYFAVAKRLVIDSGGTVKTYDTGSHRISGFGQQSDRSGMTFEGDGGVVDLASLAQVN
jgi:hypothetical protein